MKITYPASVRQTETPNKPTDLASRVFDNPNFVLSWTISLFLFLVFVSFRVQRILLVWIVYGWQAYSQHRVYVIPSKPQRFSDGVLVPQYMDILTGFGMFFVTVFGLTLLLYSAIRICEHCFGNPQPGNRK